MATSAAALLSPESTTGRRVVDVEIVIPVHNEEAGLESYMDVDLSTDLDALLPLVAPLLSGHSDVAIGTRLAPGARVMQGAKRELVSRGYNLSLKTLLGNGFSDAQCGFKALRGDVARALVPLVADESWFFDTELLLLAEHNGLRIHEVPVDWVDDADSRVDVAGTAVEDLRGIGRMLRRLTAGDGALTISAAANTAADRRVTFARQGRSGRGRHYRAALVVARLPLILTVAALLAAGGAGVDSLRGDLVVVTVVSSVAAVGRFLLLRRWVFR